MVLWLAPSQVNKLMFLPMNRSMYLITSNSKATAPPPPPAFHTVFLDLWPCFPCESSLNFQWPGVIYLVLNNRQERWNYNNQQIKDFNTPGNSWKVKLFSYPVGYCPKTSLLLTIYFTITNFSSAFNWTTGNKDKFSSNAWWRSL